MLQKTHFREMSELSPDETVTPEVFDRQTISQERLHAYQEQVRTNNSSLFTTFVCGVSVKKNFRRNSRLHLNARTAISCVAAKFLDGATFYT